MKIIQFTTINTFMLSNKSYNSSHMTKVTMLLSLVSLNRWLSLVLFSASHYKEVDFSRRGCTDTYVKRVLSTKRLNQKAAY